MSEITIKTPVVPLTSVQKQRIIQMYTVAKQSAFISRLKRDRDKAKANLSGIEDTLSALGWKVERVSFIFSETYRLVPIDGTETEKVEGE